MTEPDVALTDYGLAVLGGALALVLYRDEPAGELRSWFALLLASVAAAPLFGGTVHGFFLDESSLGNRVLWPATLLSIGVTTLCLWTLGAQLLVPHRARAVTALAVIQLVLFALAVFFWTQSFALAVVNYLPAVLFLLVAALLTRRRHAGAGLGTIAWGLALTFPAAAIQQLEIAPHPTYFNHNALYHVVQAVAIGLVFQGARALTRDPPGGGHAHAA